MLGRHSLRPCITCQANFVAEPVRKRICRWSQWLSFSTSDAAARLDTAHEQGANDDQGRDPSHRLMESVIVLPHPLPRTVLSTESKQRARNKQPRPRPFHQLMCALKCKNGFVNGVNDCHQYDKTTKAEAMIAINTTRQPSPTPFHQLLMDDRQNFVAAPQRWSHKKARQDDIHLFAGSLFHLAKAS